MESENLNEEPLLGNENLNEEPLLQNENQDEFVRTNIGGEHCSKMIDLALLYLCKLKPEARIKNCAKLGLTRKAVEIMTVEQKMKFYHLMARYIQVADLCWFDSVLNAPKEAKVNPEWFGLTAEEIADYQNKDAINAFLTANSNQEPVKTNMKFLKDEMSLEEFIKALPYGIDGAELVKDCFSARRKFVDVLAFILGATLISAFVALIDNYSYVLKHNLPLKSSLRILGYDLLFVFGTLLLEMVTAKFVGRGTCLTDEKYCEKALNKVVHFDRTTGCFSCRTPMFLQARVAIKDAAEQNALISQIDEQQPLLTINQL